MHADSAQDDKGKEPGREWHLGIRAGSLGFARDFAGRPAFLSISSEAGVQPSAILPKVGPMEAAIGRRNVIREFD
jgi:hypothetical protein